MNKRPRDPSAASVGESRSRSTPSPLTVAAQLRPRSESTGGTTLQQPRADQSATVAATEQAAEDRSAGGEAAYDGFGSERHGSDTEPYYDSEETETETEDEEDDAESAPAAMVAPPPTAAPLVPDAGPTILEPVPITPPSRNGGQDSGDEETPVTEPQLVRKNPRSPRTA